MDASTTTLSRPSVARVCVELDLRKSRPEKVWIINGAEGFWQPVMYENIPPLCSHCQKIGHQSVACRSVDPCHETPVLPDHLKESLIPKVRQEYRPKTTILSFPQECSDKIGFEAVPLRSATDAIANASGLNCSTLPEPTLSSSEDKATSVGISNSSVCLPTPSLILDNMMPTVCNLDIVDTPPDLVAVCHAYDSAPPLARTCRIFFDDIQMSEVVVQDSVQMPLSETVTQTATKEPPTETSAQSLAGAVLQSSDVATAGAPSMLVDDATASANSISNSALSTPSLQPTPSQLNDQSMTVAVQRSIAVAAVQQNSGASAVAALVPSNIQKMPTSSPNQPFSRAELDDLLKNVDDSPLPFFRRRLVEKLTPPKVQEASTSTCEVSHPSSDIILAPEIVDIAPLAVLHGDDASCFTKDNEDFYDEENEFFLPIDPPSRVRGKNKKPKAPSDRVLRQRRNRKH